MESPKAIATRGANDIECHVSLPTRELMRQSVASSTLRVYRTALVALEDWLSANSRELDDDSLADYLSDLHCEGKSVSRVATVVASVNWSCRFTGRRAPVGELSASTLKGIRRAQRHRTPCRARGLDWTQTELAAQTQMQAGGVKGIRNAAILLVMSDCLLRISEVSNLLWQDVRTAADGSGRLLVRVGKTDQNAEGAELFCGQPTMELVNLWLCETGIKDGFLFRSLTRGGRLNRSTLSSRSIGQIVKESALAIGIAGASGHSLRIGSAQELARSGASMSELMDAGRWTSERMPAHYSRAQLAERNPIARFKYKTT